MPKREDINLRVQIERLDTTQVRLDIEVPSEDVNAALKETYESLRTQVSIPGFRKGRVPVAILKSRFPDYVNSEAVRYLVAPAYEDAIYREKLNPLSQPIFTPPLDELRVKENQPLTFSATVDIRPNIDIPRYEELVTDKNPVDVPREDVDAYITRLQAQSATYEPLDTERPVAEKDCVRVDWECLINQERVEAESRQDVDIELGIEALNEKLEQTLIGMQIGETKSVAIDFPQEHPTPDLAGQSAEYNITLHAITQKHLPALDDEFAKDLGYENYSQLYGLIWNNLVEEETSLHVDKQKAELLAQLIEKTDIAIPEPLVDQYVQQTLQNVKQQLATEQRTAEDAGINMDTLPDELRRDVIQQTKQSWIFDTIAEAEGIYVSDDELEYEVRRAAEQQNRDAQKYAALLKSSNRLEELRGQLQHEKIYQFLIHEASAKQSLIIT
ncbi:trigger factor [Candidatus Poribacteria bacterium]|nr:trigger factor [Candidatus Poribacteria bacterium]MYH79975.1 trigger factor [Candidatus Poribacteria bacterium]